MKTSTISSGLRSSRGLESATLENLPVAHKLASSVICLPMYAFMENADVERVIECVRGER